MKKRTTKQIIDDLITLVNKQGGRSIDLSGVCYYKHPTKELICAHSMALKKEYRDKVLTYENKDGTLDTSAGNIISIFGGDHIHLKKYQGYSPVFWNQIQMLHDNGDFWTKNLKLTKEGKEKSNFIIKNFS